MVISILLIITAVRLTGKKNAAAAIALYFVSGGGETPYGLTRPEPRD
jgi:hypothetical protein